MSLVERGTCYVDDVVVIVLTEDKRSDQSET